MYTESSPGRNSRNLPFFPTLASAPFVMQILKENQVTWDGWMPVWGVWAWSGQANASNAAILAGLIPAGYFQRERCFIDICTRCLVHGTHIIFCISVPAAPLSWVRPEKRRRRCVLIHYNLVSFRLITCFRARNLHVHIHTGFKHDISWTMDTKTHLWTDTSSYFHVLL